MQDQLSLIGAGPELPEGFRYRPEIISADEEPGLLERIRELPLQEFAFHGFTGKRRVISYGWKYDFEERAVRKAEDIPAWLLPLREVAAGFAGIAADQLQQALVTEYDVGAAIGWHRDKAVFGDVIGISLLSSCRFRLRRKAGTKWERASLIADAPSAYLLRGRRERSGSTAFRRWMCFDTRSRFEISAGSVRSHVSVASVALGEG